MGTFSFFLAVFVIACLGHYFCICCGSTEFKMNYYEDYIHTQTRSKNKEKYNTQLSHINASSATDLENAGKREMIEWHAFAEYVYCL